MALKAKDRVIAAQNAMNVSSNRLKLAHNTRANALEAATSERQFIQQLKEELTIYPGLWYWTNEIEERTAEDVKIAFNVDLKKYNNIKENIRSLEEELRDENSMFERLSSYEQSLPWHDAQPVGSTDADIEAMLLDILKRYSVEKGLLDGKIQRLIKNKRTVESFIDSNRDYTVKDIEYLSSLSSEEIEERRSRLSEIEEALKLAIAHHSRTVAEVEAHAKEYPEVPEELSAETLAETQAALERQWDDKMLRCGHLAQQLADDETNVQTHSGLLAQIEKAQNELSRWKQLNDMLGDSTGEKFKRIALGFILSALLDKANEYLRRLTDRYILKLIPGTYNIDIVDHHKGDTQRSANTGSGGESFMISLSLALALSDVSSSLAVDVLFIDEGFSTLSDEPLASVVSLLTRLHKDSGRRVGIISHVDALIKEIDVQIKVEKDPASATSHIRTVCI